MLKNALIECIFLLFFQKLSEKDDFFTFLAEFLKIFVYICTKNHSNTMSNNYLIGRHAEKATLDRLYKSKRAQFVAIYGRRRVGKSFLINEFFGDKLLLSVVGTYVKDADNDSMSYRRLQLEHFFDAVRLADPSFADQPRPTCWREAFVMLRQLLTKSTANRKVVFFDELPWLAGPQSSEMIAELGYFWNSWAGARHDVMLIVCGSATSWMLDNVIRDYGGLHGRLTEVIKLQPFSLSQCEEFYKERGLNLSRYEICVGYMAMGGIPYYMDKLRGDMSMTDNIDRLFFANRNIHQEFKDVYAGLYSSKDRYIDIVTALGSHFYGLTQAEIAAVLKIKSGGTLTKMLDNLTESGIVRVYPRYGRRSRVETVYQLTDFFSLFYLRFINGHQHSRNQWNTLHRTPAYYTWTGETFELLCIAHLEQIKAALRLPSVERSYCWVGSTPEGTGVQIDLVLESKAARTDYVCEIKFATTKFAVSKDYELSLLNKVDAFATAKLRNKTHSLQLVMIATMGVVDGRHSGAVNRVIDMDDLYADIRD